MFSNSSFAHPVILSYIRIRYLLYEPLYKKAGIFQINLRETAFIIRSACCVLWMAFLPCFMLLTS
ncbi:hypothetical protein ES705_30086 [subsurface metagenome]